MSNTDREPLKRFANGFGMVIAGFAVVFAYGLVFLGPVILAIAAVHTTMQSQPQLIRVGVFVLIALFSYAVSVGLAEMVGLLDMENATGRVPPK